MSHLAQPARSRFGNICQDCHRVVVRAPHDCTRSTLYAAAESTHLTASVATVEPPTEEGDRHVSGLVLPYGPVGYTSAGPVRVLRAGTIAVPPAEQLGRIKLVDEHQTPPVAVGYCTELRDTPEGLRARFYVARTEAGDRALADVRERVRDGFSVELNALELAGDEVTAGQLSAVALVTTPAWADAREDGLAASHNPTHERNNGMTEEQRKRLAELLAKSDRTEAENTELRELSQLAMSEAGQVDPDPAGTGDQTPDAQASQLAASALAQLAASLPGSLPGGQRRTQRRELRELYAAQARVLSGQSRPELEAALSDITSTANIWVAGDEYAGQLWSGLDYSRRFVPLLTPGELRSYKGTGWRWVTKPAVADYAGDKAAVPSNAPTTESVAWTAARLAGAHDLDRKFVDFGDTEFIDAYYAAMRESYARQSDDKARAFLIANAKPAGAAGPTIFHAAAVAAQASSDATGGAAVDYILVNSADRLALLDVVSADVPAYLEAFGVTPDKFISAPGVAAGTVIAGNRQSAKFRELPGSPIRVEAINVANGGVDGGVFGYYAVHELVDGGIASATFAAV